MKTPDFMELIQGKGYLILYRVVSSLRFAFVVCMVVYVFFCLTSLFLKLFFYVEKNLFSLSFNFIKEFLTDALFVLIILDFISAMFYSKRIHYVLALLEIGFIVVARKLILLEPKPENAFLILVLTLAVSLFFLLIFYFYKITGRLRNPKNQN